MTIFQYLEVFAAFATSAGMPVSELAEIVAVSGDGAALHERAAILSSKVAADLDSGNASAFISTWMVINQLDEDGKRYNDVLQSLVDLAVEMDEAEIRKSPEEIERWLSILEMILGEARPKQLESLKELGSLPSKYAILAISTGNGDRASRWFYTLSEDNEPFFYAGLKMGNQLPRRLKNLVNPGEVDPEELDTQPRIDLVRAYLKHPFFHRLKPFNHESFGQMVEWKILSPDELFENGDELVAAHFRQGMAYLDLAREYRKAGRFDKALVYLDKGMTTRLQLKNRLGCYLLEKVIVHRDAGEIDKAWQTMNEVPNEDLDQGNRKLRAKVIASLSELDR